MYLIDEEDLSLGETREEWDDIGLLLDCRATRRLDRGCHLMCDDGRDRCFPESRRPIEQYMFEGLFSDFGWFDRDSEVLLHLSLPDIFRESLRTQWYLGYDIFFAWLRLHHSVDIRGFGGLDRHMTMIIYKKMEHAKGKSVPIYEKNTQFLTKK